MVLLHAFFATAMSWYATVSALAERHRVFAVDIMGEANRSRPTRVISSRDDYLRWFSELFSQPKLVNIGHELGTASSVINFSRARFALTKSRLTRHFVDRAPMIM